MPDALPYQTIRIETEGDLSWIVLNRPEKSNALSGAMLEEFSNALELLKTEGGKVIAIRGEGAGFSAGYDLGGSGGYGQPDPVQDEARLRRNIERYLAIWDHPKPVIAAVHGFCIAGATRICCYADIVIVTHDARIGEPTIPLGGGYIAPLWVPQVGARRAKEFAFVPGNWIDGRTAVEWGWANHSVAPDELLSAVAGLARRIALTPASVLRMKKLAINRAAEACGYREAASSGAQINALLHGTPEVQALRRELDSVGLKAMTGRFRTDPTTPLAGTKKTLQKE